MKNPTSYVILSLLILHAIFCSRAAMGQKRSDALPPQLDGSMMPINLHDADSIPIWGDSLRPVYAAYVARHGARFLSSQKKVASLQNILYAKAISSSLTTRGERFLKLIGEITKKTGSDWGELTDVGIYEQHRLARQLNMLVPELVKNASIRACATYVPRVVMSMYQFCWELDRLNPSVELYQGFGRRYNPLLRFFTTDSLYRHWREEGDWKEIYHEFMQRNVSVEPAVRLLGSTDGFSPDSLRDITMMMYGVLQSLRAAYVGEPDEYFMSEEEYRACWMADNLEQYLRNTISPADTSCAGAASYLLSTIIKDADEALGIKQPYQDLPASNNDSAAYDSACHNNKSRKPGDESISFDASLYFGHAETLMPLFSLMDLPGCRAIPLDYNDVADQWRNYDIVPLGANLLIIFLKNKEGEIYTATRLNGKFIRPLKGKQEIVDWRDLSGYWRTLLIDD